MTAWGKRARTALIVGSLGLPFSGCGKGEVKDLDAIDPQKLLERLNADRRRHDPQNFVEVDLGEYNITYRDAGKNRLLYLNFRVFAVLHEKQKPDVETALKARGKRMRDSVIGVVQRTELGHLNDARLDWLKSELIPTINKVLETRAIRDVIIPQFEITGL